MRFLLFLILVSIQSFGQKGLFMYNDTMWQIRGTKTGDTTAVLYARQLKDRYSLTVQAMSYSPNDSQTDYFGNSLKTPTTTQGISKIYIRKKGTIKTSEIYSYSEVAGSNEPWAIYIRLNNNTDFLVSSLSVSANERIFSNPNMFIPVNPGDYIEVKSVNPVWATNPSTTNFSGYVIIEDTVSGPAGSAPSVAVSLKNAFMPMAGDLIVDYAAGTWTNNQVLEPSFFYDSATSSTKMYYTGSSDVSGPSFDNRVGLSSSIDNITYSANANNPLVGQGSSGTPIGRRVHSSWVGKLGQTYYMLASNGYGYNYSGEDRNVYGYTSTDGINWVDKGLKINKSTAWGSGVLDGFANCSVVTDQFNKPVIIGGKYMALIEGNYQGVWQLFRAQADSLMGTWTITNRLNSLQVVAGGMYGGACTIFANGKYHVFYHYGAAIGNLPTYLAYASSTDGINWAIKEAPFKTILATPYPNTDQIADPFVCEINGKVYLMAEYVQNSPVYHGQIRQWVYNGNFLNLIKNLP